MLKCHVAVVTEHEGLTETELPNAGLHWLISLMNFPSLSLRKSAVSELADLLLLPLSSAARDRSLHPRYACIHTHTCSGDTFNTGLEKYLLIEDRRSVSQDALVLPR